MKSEIFKGKNGITYERISKPTAKQLFKQGENVYCLMENVRRDDYNLTDMRRYIDEILYKDLEKNFDAMCNELLYYAPKEYGRKLNFYRIVK